MESQKEELVRGALDRLTTTRGLPGIQYAAAGADGIRFEHQSGVSDLSTGTRVSPNTTFMASSSTKVLTAAAILQLVERKALHLDQPFTAYYPNHPYGGNITIRHLLAQTSGIPNPLPLKWIHRISEHDGFNEESALQEVMRRHSKPKSWPGEKYGYSNISYWLLGKVIEAVSGHRYCEYIQSNIFDPLGIPVTAAGFTVSDLSLHATGYQTRLSTAGLFLYAMMDRRMLGKTVRGRMSLLPVYMNGPAYGGLICTATAFARFLQDVLQEKPRTLSKKTRTLFLTPQLTDEGRETGMTLGWRTGQLNGETYFGKPGGGPGFQSNVRLYPQKGLATAWLANETGVNEAQMNLVSDSVDRYWLA